MKVFMTIEDDLSKKKKVLIRTIPNNGNTPIITLTQGEGKFNFVLETGSDVSILCNPKEDKIKVSSMILTTGGNGVAGKGIATENGIYRTPETNVVDFAIQGQKHAIPFVVSPHLSGAFEIFEKNTGIHLTGVLGTDFLSKYHISIQY